MSNPTKLLTITQLQNDMLRMLDDAFKPQPTRALIFNTQEAVYEIFEYPTGWTIRKGEDSMVLTNGLTEEEMWTMLKLLK